MGPTRRKRLGTAAFIAACISIAGLLVGCDGGTFIKGVVRDSANKPVPDATVTLTVEERTHEVKSLADGAFKIGTLHSPSNPELSLSVTKPGYRPFEKRFHSSEQLSTIVITVEPLAAAQESASRPHRSVAGLPRYMTDIPQLIPDQIRLPDAPKTVRHVECFFSFTSDSTMTDVVRQCGIPDEHQGSGIWIFLYDMDDGSLVAVGTPDLKRLLYVDHISGTAKAKSLLRQVQSK